MKKTSQSISSVAFAHAVHGLSVMPAGPDKRPLLKSWKSLQTTPAMPEQVQDWFEQYPEANLAIITGEVSGITVLDLDHEDGKPFTPVEAFPETYTVRTPSGGYHLYYQYVPGFTISARAYPQFPGLDMRSDGGYVVAPPSTTPAGAYEVIKNIPYAPFPTNLFPSTATKTKTLAARLGVSTGSRNDSMASFIGTLLKSRPDKEWETDVWPAVIQANRTYTPPLPDKELRSIFESIVKKELAARADMVLSPIQPGGANIKIPLRRNSANVPYKDMANVYIVLERHPYFKDNIRYNEFREQIEYKGQELDDSAIEKIQFFMQNDAGLPGVSKEAVFSAISHYSHQNSYDEVKDWVRSLVWDGVPRLHEWLATTTRLTNNAYYTGIGCQWFMGMINRMMNPGTLFDYMLVLVGKQGTGKTSMFRIIGGPWYKNFTGNMDNKDFYLALRGAVLVDLDEASSLKKSDTIKMKSVISDTHDEFRAPYGRTMKKYPRRFVFSMTTNDTEVLQDTTGNRRYWIVDMEAEKVNFKWLEDNRDQLFAEAYYHLVNKTALPEVPIDMVLEYQELHIAEDIWLNDVNRYLSKNADYCEGSEDYHITLNELYEGVFPEDDLSRIGRPQQMRLANILRKLGFEKKRVMIDRDRVTYWKLSDEKIKELQANHLKQTKDEETQAEEDWGKI